MRRKPAELAADIKSRTIGSLAKLGDKDTQRPATDDLFHIIQNLSEVSLGSFVSLVTEPDDAFAQKPFARRECARLFGLLAIAHGDALLPYLQKILHSLLKRMKDSDSTVREACAESFGLLAKHITASPTSIHTFLSPLFSSLSEQNKSTQLGAALCIARVVFYTGEDRVEAALSKLAPRLIKALSQPNLFAAVPLMYAVANLVEIVSDSLAPYLPSMVFALISSLSSPDWLTRRTASEALDVLASRISGPTLAPCCRDILRALDATRFDKVKPVRDAVVQSLHTYTRLAATFPGSFDDDDDPNNVTNAPSSPPLRPATSPASLHSPAILRKRHAGAFADASFEVPYSAPGASNMPEEAGPVEGGDIPARRTWSTSTSSVVLPTLPASPSSSEQLQPTSPSTADQSMSFSQETQLVTSEDASHFSTGETHAGVIRAQKLRSHSFTYGSNEMTVRTSSGGTALFIKADNSNVKHVKPPPWARRPDPSPPPSAPVALSSVPVISSRPIAPPVSTHLPLPIARTDATSTSSSTSIDLPPITPSGDSTPLTSSPKGPPVSGGDATSLPALTVQVKRLVQQQRHMMHMMETFMSTTRTSLEDLQWRVRSLEQNVRSSRVSTPTASRPASARPMSAARSPLSRPSSSSSHRRMPPTPISVADLPADGRIDHSGGMSQRNYPNSPTPSLRLASRALPAPIAAAATVQSPQRLPTPSKTVRMDVSIRSTMTASPSAAGAGEEGWWSIVTQRLHEGDIDGAYALLLLVIDGDERQGGADQGQAAESVQKDFAMRSNKLDPLLRLMRMTGPVVPRLSPDTAGTLVSRLAEQLPLLPFSSSPSHESTTSLLPWVRQLLDLPEWPLAMNDTRNLAAALHPLTLSPSDTEARDVYAAIVRRLADQRAAQQMQMQMQIAAKPKG